MTNQNNQLAVLDDLYPVTLPVPSERFFETKKGYQERTKQFQLQFVQDYETYVDMVSRMAAGKHKIESLATQRKIEIAREQYELECINMDRESLRLKQELLRAQLDTALAALEQQKEHHNVNTYRIQNEQRKALGLTDTPEPLEKTTTINSAPKPTALTPRQQIDANILEMQQINEDELGHIAKITALNPPDLEFQIDVVRGMYEDYKRELATKKSRT
jgi:hypothetical protein